MAFLFFPGPWYTGNMLPWHGRVRGSIPLGSTASPRLRSTGTFIQMKQVVKKNE